MNLCRFLMCVFLSVLPLEIPLTRGEGRDSINRFYPDRFLCLFQAITWISNTICHGLIWGEMWLLVLLISVDILKLCFNKIMGRTIKGVTYILWSLLSEARTQWFRWISSYYYNSSLSFIFFSKFTKAGSDHWYFLFQQSHPSY